MKTRWDYVTTVESESEPGKTYDIKRRGGLYGCDCTAYRFSRGTKTCKHLEAYLGLGVTRQVFETASRAVPTVPAYTTARVGAETYTFTRRGITFGDIPVGR